MKCAPQTKLNTKLGYTERKDRREDLNAAYVGAEEMRTGNEFQIKGALINIEKHLHKKACTVMSLRCFTGRKIVCKIYTI